MCIGRQIGGGPSFSRALSWISPASTKSLDRLDKAHGAPRTLTEKVSLIWRTQNISIPVSVVRSKIHNHPPTSFSLSTPHPLRLAHISHDRSHDTLTTPFKTPSLLLNPTHNTYKLHHGLYILLPSINFHLPWRVSRKHFPGPRRNWCRSSTMPYWHCSELVRPASLHELLLPRSLVRPPGSVVLYVLNKPRYESGGDEWRTGECGWEISA